MALLFSGKTHLIWYLLHEASNLWKNGAVFWEIARMRSYFVNITDHVLDFSLDVGCSANDLGDGKHSM